MPSIAESWRKSSTVWVSLCLDSCMYLLENWLCTCLWFLGSNWMKFSSQNTWLFLSFCVVQFFSSWDRVASFVFVAGVCSCSLCFSVLACSSVFLPNVLVKKQLQEAIETARKNNILLYLLRTFPRKVIISHTQWQPNLWWLWQDIQVKVFVIIIIYEDPSNFIGQVPAQNQFQVR